MSRKDRTGCFDGSPGISTQDSGMFAVKLNASSFGYNRAACPVRFKVSSSFRNLSDFNLEVTLASLSSEYTEAAMSQTSASET